LLSATLELITRRLLGLLDAARTESLPVHTLLPLRIGMVKSATIQPYLRLWIELLSLAAAGQEPFRSIARRISTAFRSWIAAALQIDTEGARDPLAALTLTIIEGVVMFDALGTETVIEGNGMGIGSVLRSKATGRWTNGDGGAWSHCRPRAVRKPQACSVPSRALWPSRAGRHSCPAAACGSISSGRTSTTG
jgi:hypothetical protein